MNERRFAAVMRKTPYQSKTPLLSGSRIHERWAVERQFAEVENVLFRDGDLERIRGNVFADGDDDRRKVDAGTMALPEGDGVSTKSQRARASAPLTDRLPTPF